MNQSFIEVMAGACVPLIIGYIYSFITILKRDKEITELKSVIRSLSPEDKITIAKVYAGEAAK